MTGHEIAEQLHEQALIALDEEGLSVLLESFEVLRADDTCVAGWIRILSTTGLVMVQEETPDREILLRRVGSREAAERLVEHRLAAYEKMWDGCGCTIDYHRASDAG
jgi:hypothetical protein